MRISFDGIMSGTLILSMISAIAYCSARMGEYDPCDHTKYTIWNGFVGYGTNEYTIEDGQIKFISCGGKTHVMSEWHIEASK